MEKMLTVNEFAEKAGVSVQAVYKQLKGNLAEYLVAKDGKKYLKPSALDYYRTGKKAESERKNNPSRTANKKDSYLKEIERLNLEIAALRSENENLRNELEDVRRSYDECFKTLKTISSISLRATNAI